LGSSQGLLLNNPLIVSQQRLNEWLALLGGEGWKGREARDRPVEEMQAIGADSLFTLLRELLTESDLEIRC
jgi:hypothetical protein